MRFFIGYRFVSIVAAVVIAMLPVGASASSADHAGHPAGSQLAFNIPWD